MNFKTGDIEEFFLNTLLRITIAGVLSILVSDILLYPDDTTSIAIDVVILLTCLISYSIRRKSPTASVLTLATIVLSAMIYQCLAVPANTTTSLSVFLIIGFIFSVMLKGKLLWTMHCVTFLLQHAIFIFQFLNPDLRFSPHTNEVVTVAITYSILYFILTYASWVLKLRYDEVNKDLKVLNRELHENAHEIEAQNEELIQTQQNLFELNIDLEKKVNDRTAQIRAQNEMLIKYSYTNAHHLRAPVARLLGLAAMYKLDPKIDCNFLINKMIDEANAIDSVVKNITVDLEKNIN